MKRYTSSSVLLSALLCALVSCSNPAPSGLAPTPPGSGPTVVFEPLHLPTPEIPFPNDVATRIDPLSPTGRRLNLATSVPLALEQRLRHQFNRLDGFSVTGAVTVSFDAPLDLSTVNGESVFLVDITAGSPELGRRVPLDFGEGAFPVNQPSSSRPVFPFDTDAELPDLLFGPDNEIEGQRLSGYEVSTNTLILRPLFPLRPRTTYAAVLTKSVQGKEGESVRSPFLSINHAAQSSALAALPSYVPGGLDSIAFTWSFTTRSVVDDLVAIRRGMDGEGVLGWLKTSVPPAFSAFTDTDIEWDGDGSVEALPHDPKDHLYTLKPAALPVLLGALGLVDPGLASMSFDHVDYMVLGRLELPDFRGSDRTVRVDPIQGLVATEMAEVPFMLSVPRETEQWKPPFPVILYNHGARTSRLEIILVADAMARAGLAVLSIDAAGHGPFFGDLEQVLEREAPPEIGPELIAGLMGGVAQSFLGLEYDFSGKSLGEILLDLTDHGLFQDIFLSGRAEDLDGDGVLVSGDGYFVPNPFELASSGQQTVLDCLGVYRLLRGLRADAVPPALADPRSASYEELLPHLKAGDFNADGVLDIGGADNRYYAMGTSLGGFHTSVLLAVEPELVTGVPLVSGGGMIDVMLRTTLTQAVDPILVEPLGPALVGCPIGENEVALSWNNASVTCRNAGTIELAEQSSGLARIERVPGGTVSLRNERLAAGPRRGAHSEYAREASITEEGAFGVVVAADVGDLLTLTLRDADGETVATHTIEARHAGLGFQRNTPRFRRLVQVAQIAMDAADPMAYARYLIREPLDGTPRNVLHLTAIGDRTVPFATMVAWDRAAGLHGLDEEDALAVTEAFLTHDALKGQSPYWDIDDLLQTGDGIGPLPVIETASGVSAVRHAATRQHEYIAMADPDADFDWATYSRNQILHFFSTDGTDIADDLCLEDGSCTWLP